MQIRALPVSNHVPGNISLELESIKHLFKKVNNTIFFPVYTSDSVFFHLSFPVEPEVIYLSCGLQAYSFVTCKTFC